MWSPSASQLVSQRAGEAPNFALVEGRQAAAGPGLTFLPQLAVYETDGSLYARAEANLRDRRESEMLYIVATPIGNMEDITLRALRILKEADFIAAEDTRHTRGLLTRYDIKTKLVSFHEHSAPEKRAWLIGELKATARTSRWCPMRARP